MTDHVVVGRVGRPHGIGGAFVVEHPSDDAARFAVGAELVGGRAPRCRARSKRSGGRWSSSSTGRVERGAALEVPRSSLPPPEPDSYYVFQLVGLDVVEEGGRALGTVDDVAPDAANDVLELDSGMLLPLVEACVRESTSEAGESLSRPASPTPANLACPVQIDVFTLVPHAFAWLTEQRPLAAVLGDELDLRLFNYRDTTPLRAGQVDDEPYGGGAGMVLRVDVVAAALDAVYGGCPEHRVVALTPAGPPADAGGRRGARRRGAADAPLGALRGLRRADRRAPRDRRDLDRPVRALGRRAAGDGARRRDRPAAAGRARQRGVGRARELLAPSSSGGLEYPHYTRPAEFRGWRVPDVLLSGDHGRSTSGGASRAGSERARLRNPIDRLTGLPHAWRVAIDWIVTIVGAVAIVLAIKAWVVNPYRIPSSSMEPTLHCARPAPGCEARFSDRVLANRFIYHFSDPQRGDIVVFNTPPRARAAVRRGRHVRQADHRPPGRDVGGAERLRLHQREEADEPYIQPGPQRLDDVPRP